MPTNPSLRTRTRVRRAMPDDAPAMAEVFVESWRSTYPGLLPEKALLRMTSERLTPRLVARLSSATRNDVQLVAERVGGGIIGLAQAGLVLDKGLQIDNDAVTSEIYTLYVAPEAQGEGAGALLLSGLLDRLRSRGHANCVAWMVERNVSRFFYEHMGARKIATRRAREWGKVVSLEAYAWPDIRDRA